MIDHRVGASKVEQLARTIRKQDAELSRLREEVQRGFANEETCGRYLRDKETAEKERDELRERLKAAEEVVEAVREAKKTMVVRTPILTALAKYERTRP